MRMTTDTQPKTTPYIPKQVMDVKINFQKIINNTSPKTADGKNEYYTKSIVKNLYEDKQGKHVEDYHFSLFNHKNEQLQFHLSGNGILRYVDYTFWNNKTPEKTFIGKDLEKLAATVKDPKLVEMAQILNWEKVPPRDQTHNDDVTQEAADIELD